MRAKDKGDIQSATEGSLGANLQDAESRPRKPYGELLALSRVSAAVSGLWNLDAILDVALDTVLDIMNGTIGGILLIDEQTQVFPTNMPRRCTSNWVKESQGG